MQDLESELRLLLRERAQRLTSPPPRSKRRPASKAPRRRAVVIAAAALLAVAGAGIAISQGVGPFRILPVGETFEVASGATEEGSWRLSFYLAEVETGSSAEPERVWCLDLDRSWVDDPEVPTPQEGNACTEGQYRDHEHLGPLARLPRFTGDDALVYGAVSDDVARITLRFDGGDVQRAEVTPAPEETGQRVGLFATLVEGVGIQQVEVIATDRNGRVLETARL